jgi:hypothetical protein
MCVHMVTSGTAWIGIAMRADRGAEPAARTFFLWPSAGPTGITPPKILLGSLGVAALMLPVWISGFSAGSVEEESSRVVTWFRERTVRLAFYVVGPALR